MDYEVIAIRLLLSFLFSGIIGYEREVNQSNAGLKTHILVALGATLVALIQVEIIYFVRELAIAHPEGPINVTSDASRLIAQVVSGIGFLGAGTIIVTKRNVSGLTTAASIWAVASIGLALGMGFYPIAILGFSFIILTLFIFNKLINVGQDYRIIVKYLDGYDILSEIKASFIELSLEYEMASYKSEVFADYIIRENVFIITRKDSVDFQDIVSQLSKTKNIVSVERTNLY